MASTDTPYDALIIGTGMAALAAARQLAGFRLLLVDARDRIGGRILTASVPLADPPAGKAPPVPTAQVDLGGSMVHGFNEGNPVAGLIPRDLDMVSSRSRSTRKGRAAGRRRPLPPPLRPAPPDGTSLARSSVCKGDGN